jgi:general secretion pathway protein D
MHSRRLPILALGIAAILLSGCPKGGQDAKLGTKEEQLQDYDAALAHYQHALHEDPNNTEYKLKAARARFEASNYHLGLGQKFRDKGDLSNALVEFQKAASIDPSNSLAGQELQHTLELVGERNAAQAAPGLPSVPEPALMEGPPKLVPPTPSIHPLKMTNDSKVIFETIAKLAGLTVIFDPDFTSHRITVELPNVTYDQALDIAALQSKAFWKPVTSNIIFVSNGDAAKRKEFEEEVVRIFYLSNITSDKDLTEIVTAIRNLFQPALSKINIITAQNAIVVRDTPDKVMLVGRIIDRLDKARAEVVVEVSIAEVNRDVVRNLGVTPSTSPVAALTFSPPTSTTSAASTTTTATSAASIALNMLKHLSSTDYQVTLPSATVNAMLNDSNTKILQNPELRSVDGQHATLRIGDRVPVATGSFQAGIGAGVGTAGASVVSPLVNTQFQYQDVGVNVDLTPHILPNRDVAMHVKVEVSSVTGSVNIGGINQPTISQRVVEHDVRLKDGEVNVLAGLIERSDTNTLNGYPGLARIPILRYMFSGDNTEHVDDEILIILTPRVVRMPDITAEDLQSIASGTDANPQVRLVDEAPPQPLAATAVPQVQSTPQPLVVYQTPGVNVIAAGPTVAAQSSTSPVTPNGPPGLRFEPSNLTLKPGETATVGVVVENVKDLSSIPLLLQYNPAVISVGEARHGGFLGGDSQDAIVQRVDQPHGQATFSVTRGPNTPGVNGTGTVVAFDIKAIAPGDTKLSIVQVNAKDSQQRPIQLVTAEGSIHVQQ